MKCEEELERARKCAECLYGMFWQACSALESVLGWGPGYVTCTDKETLEKCRRLCKDIVEVEY